MATKFLDKTGLSHFWSKIKAWCNATFAAITHSHAWSTITSKPTTISGYGITDAKIANGTITLGSNSITPLTSVPNHNQASNTINAMTGYSKPSSGSAIAASDSLNNAIGKLEAKVDAIDDNDYVHKIGDETIEGTKRFKPNYVITSDTDTGSSIVIKSSSYSRTGTSVKRYNWFGLYLEDKDNNSLVRDTYNYFPGRVGCLEHFCDTQGTSTYIRLLCNKGSYSAGTADDASVIIVGFDSNGTKFARAPSTSEDRSNNEDIITRDWIPKDTRIVHTTSNETIAGTKTFSSSPIVPTPTTSDNSTKVATTAFVKAQGYVTTDTKVRQFEGTVNANRPILSRWDGGDASGTANYVVYDDNISINPNKHTLTASGGFKGNADTATKLYTARTINGVSFDGSANITVVDSTKLPLAGGTLTGNVVQKFTAYERGVSTTAYTRELIDVKDKNNVRFALIETTVAADKSSKTCLFAYKTTAASGNNIGSLGIGCDASGNVYTVAPTPATADNSTKIATTAFVKAQGYITSSGNTATATKLANARTISLSGAITGSTSFDGSINSEISAVWRSCVLGQSGSSSTNPWYKVAACSMNDHDDSTITFLVEGTYSWHSTGILKLHVRTEGDSKVRLDATEIFWVSCTRSIADTLDQYVLVCPTTASPTVELWTKITDPYMHRRFTVLSEGSRAYTWVRWTLFNASTAGQAASITTSGTQIESSITSVSTYCTGNCSGTSSNVTGTVAIANGGTGATTRLNAIKALTNENVGTNATHFLGLKSDWSKVGYFTLAEAKTLLGLKSAAYTESSAYATASHTHSNYLTSHQSLANYVTLNSTQEISGSKHFSGGLNRKHGSQDVTVKSPASDVWSIIGFIDKNNQGMLDFNMIQGNNQRVFWIRMYDMNKEQHWMFNVVLPADASSAGYINMPHTYPMSSANTLGSSSKRWGSVWAVNGAIQTSDERVKEDIDVIPDEVLDAWEQVEWLQFRMKDSVKTKGSNARLHSGVIAQRIKSAFDLLGVNPADYGFFCWDEWDTTPASYDKEGNVITAEIPAGEQYSIRYDEALAIEAAYQRRKNKILETRISELEKRLAKLEGAM